MWFIDKIMPKGIKGFLKGHKMNLGNKFWFGKKHSDKTKEKMRLSAKRVGTGKWMKGRKITEEHLNRIKTLGFANKGRKRPDLIERNKTEWMREISRQNGKSVKGRKHTKEELEKMKMSHLGKKHTEAVKRKIGLAHQGEKCNFWKGGITPKHKAIRTTLDYDIWRLSVFERDNFTCQMPGCGVRGGRLEAHHIKEFSKYPELIFDKNNGITLCENHHKQIKNKESQFENLFLEIIKCHY